MFAIFINCEHYYVVFLIIKSVPPCNVKSENDFVYFNSNLSLAFKNKKVR